MATATAAAKEAWTAERIEGELRAVCRRNGGACPTIREMRDLGKGDLCKAMERDARGYAGWKATMNEPQEVALERIKIDGGTQQREKIDEAHVADLADVLTAGDGLPEGEAYFDGVDYWLTDGFHRYHAHRRAELTAMFLRVVNGTRRDAILASVRANADQNALKRSRQDKRNAVRTLLADETWAGWSNNKIATAANVSADFVATVRADVTPKAIVNDSDGTRKYTTRTGKEATMRTGGIGRKPAKERELSDNGDIDPLPALTPEPAPPAKPVVVKDEEGHEIADPVIAAVFARRVEAKAIMGQLSAIKSQVSKAAESRDGLYRFVNVSELSAALSDARRILSVKAPYALCPYCSDDALARKGCQACDGGGYVPKDVWDQAPESMRKAVG